MTIFIAISAWLAFSFAVSVLVGRSAKFMRDGNYDDNPLDDEEQVAYLRERARHNG